MSFFDNFFSRKHPPTSRVARDRLQILLAHERSSGTEGDSDLIKKLHKEILEVLSRHVSVDQDKVQIKLDRGQQYSTLEIDIEVPEGKDKKKTI
ncbi:cell division topological specificity factor MinE [Aristophania vespae]|uniref:Cell division topological specificity factor n=1 Tax=Aristophania vespae TaxID=2697033 RepID=A0A6P1NJR5_9PROT|nr:cell division topological specificity factor MinE [Aristophania vespae]QHI95922.1 cell division topological specificity factor MinE [Aristophania vespae]UMM63657.1 Cell division topological specificity factor [Aristophania vespae]